jgi:hypothetical protein
MMKSGEKQMQLRVSNLSENTTEADVEKVFTIICQP